MRSNGGPSSRRSRDDTAEQFDRLRSRLAPLDAQCAEARAARRRLEARARQNGHAETAAEIGRHPERFGQLRVGPVPPAGAESSTSRRRQIETARRRAF